MTRRNRHMGEKIRVNKPSFAYCSTKYTFNAWCVLEMGDTSWR